jgi:hypothetical protein
MIIALACKNMSRPQPWPAPALPPHDHGRNPGSSPTSLLHLVIPWPPPACTVGKSPRGFWRQQAFLSSAQGAQCGVAASLAAVGVAWRGVGWRFVLGGGSCGWLMEIAAPTVVTWARPYRSRSAVTAPWTKAGTVAGQGNRSQDGRESYTPPFAASKDRAAWGYFCRARTS